MNAANGYPHHASGNSRRGTSRSWPLTPIAEGNPLYPVPKLMDAHELEHMYHMVQEHSEAECAEVAESTRSHILPRSDRALPRRPHLAVRSASLAALPLRIALAARRRVRRIAPSRPPDPSVARSLMSISDTVSRCRAHFATGATIPVDARIKALRALERAIVENEDRINEALREDLGKSATESYMCEVGMTLAELRYQLRHVRGWTRRHRVRTGLANFHATSFTVAEPYGTVLIMSPLELSIHAHNGAARWRARRRKLLRREAERLLACNLGGDARDHRELSAFRARRRCGGRTRRERETSRPMLRLHLLHGRRHSGNARDEEGVRAPHAHNARARRQEPLRHRRGCEFWRWLPHAWCSAST